MEIIPLKSHRLELPLQESRQEWLQTVFEANDQELQEGDTIVISSKIVSYFEGNLVLLDNIQPGEEALETSQTVAARPELLELVMQEADELVSSNPWVLLTLKNGIYSANAGVDTSNVPPGYAITWPKDPEESVKKIQEELRSCSKLRKLGVLMIDSICIPGRKGTIAVSLAGVGFGALQRLENEEDLFGNILRYSTLNIADSLATAANLVMGENTEACPLAIVRNAPVDFSSAYKNDGMLIPPSEDLFQM